MDTEEATEIEKAIRLGHSQTDEGPYYHESWWESYKGGVKGKLGGVVIGAVVGALVGLAAAAVLAVALTGGIAIPAALAVVGGFSASGMIYGAHEFGDVGKVTGAVAAAQEKAEIRMKSFETGKFAEIKKEISDLKYELTGKQTPVAAGATQADETYRTTHASEEMISTQSQPVFWKVATIGLVIGLAAGALMAATGMSEHILENVGVASKSLSEGGVFLASMTALGAFGASFGVNRDLFRKIFDKTDLLFRGITKPNKGHAPTIAPEPVATPEQIVEKAQGPVTTVIYEGFVEYPESDTHHRDRVLSQAKQALLSMDHTKAIPH